MPHLGLNGKLWPGMGPGPGMPGPPGGPVTTGPPGPPGPPMDPGMGMLGPPRVLVAYSCCWKLWNWAAYVGSAVVGPINGEFLKLPDCPIDGGRG